MPAPHDVLDYAPEAEQPPRLSTFGRFCVWSMAFFLVLDATLLAGRWAMPTTLYQVLCIVSFGGLVAGCLGIGVAAVEAREFRVQLLLAVLSIACVLMTVLGPLWFVTS